MCAGTKMQKLVDLLETMFGDLDPEDVNPEQLETDAIKALHQKATAAEEAAISAEHGSIPIDKITCITITSVPIPIEFGIPEASLPETENIKMPSTKNPAKKVTHFYYCCTVCSHSLQNKPSMMTLPWKCLRIKLVGQICKKEYDSTDGAENHINDVHEGHCDPKIIVPKEKMITK